MGIDARILLRVKSKPTPDELKKWSWLLGVAVGPEKLWRDKEEGRPAITLCENQGGRYEQDGDDVLASGDYLLEVHVWTRYYGLNYERGDLLGLCAIAEWCEQNIPNCEVWYGGDSSGVVAVPWPEEDRKELRQHLFSGEGRDYFRHSEQPGSFPTPELCSLCINKEGFNRYGWGGGNSYVGVSCPGCGDSFETRDGGQTWKKCERA